MKVAVISETKNVGATTFALLLGGVFAKTQGKAATYVSNGPIDVVRDMMTFNMKGSSLKSAKVIESIMLGASIQGKDLLDYAFKSNADDFYVYDLHSTTLEYERGVEALVSKTMRRIPTALTIVDIQGDINDPLIQNVLVDVDVVLYVFSPSMESMKKVKKYQEEYLGKVVRKTGYICNMFARNAVSTKRVAAEVGTNVKSLICVPYNTIIIKEAIDGTLDKVPNYIAEGNAEVTELRMPMLETMQYLFDSPQFKYIKGVEHWCK